MLSSLHLEINKKDIKLKKITILGSLSPAPKMNRKGVGGEAFNIHSRFLWLGFSPGGINMFLFSFILPKQ